MDDPGADGWETEVIHDLLKKKLGKLAELIVAEEFSAELQAPLVAEEIESSALVPSDLETISNSSGVMVRRGKAVGTCFANLFHLLPWTLAIGGVQHFQ